MGPGLGAGTVLQRFPSLTAPNPRLEGPDETSPCAGVGGGGGGVASLSPLLTGACVSS